jgi:undecaprenyl-diphosphatase
MADQSIVSALVLGLIEGLTEFLPVSSTAHVLLAGHFLGFQSPGNTFAVLIQLGAILAILLVYAQKLIQIATALPTSAKARHFVLTVLVAFLPAAIIGALAHNFIKTVLFETPMLICVMLILGGIVLLVVDKIKFKPKYYDVMDYPLSLALKIGFFQCLAMIPGTSRSGATIVGSLLMGTDKRSAAEFSFFLAMPTMLGAFVLDLYKNRSVLSLDDGAVIAVGFIAAFVTAIFVVRSLLDFVSSRGYAPFAYWRIAIGIIGLLALIFWRPAVPAIAALRPGL